MADNDNNDNNDITIASLIQNTPQSPLAGEVKLP